MNKRLQFATAVLASALMLGLSGTAYANPTPNPSETPTPTPVASAAICSAKSVIRQSALGKFYGYVVDVNSGKVLLDVRGSEATPSASVLKVVSAAAAMLTLPSDYRATTKVLTVPDQPGVIVLQGGGDHTLSRMTGESYTTYTGAPRLETLAYQVFTRWAEAYGISKIILDPNFFAGPTYNSAWKASDRTNGYISHITALQVDSDRANPDLTSKAYSGYRSTDPVLRTGQFFKEALGGLAEDAKITKGRTPKNAVEFTSVSSQPISVWLKHAIAVSDNTETEFIIRHAAKAAGLPASFSAIEPLVKQKLTSVGVDTTGLVMKDGSGLAQANRLTPKMVTEILALVAKDHPNLAAMDEYLPIAGRTGTLAGRFTGKNAVARNFVRGKSGYIPGLYSLAGTITAKDGSNLAYAIFARSGDGKKVGYSARAALDSVATRFFTCGANLGL
ncbi:D-alanyl-D-alanine carboxypeptidase/D-alanyl-D-alanine-endopeptidase [Candidatus Rhodoluna planktonica]|uniref:D-alanyl-D-alanine carboxypeptidase n=1 Tax=Candidatus Rhodoluna planktonica TaxID=535712 RepID=A0A1D9DY13_9MICO|nr:D-alanyl-D-alanine carboxypeptidase/D-alanyl-D-alanine-endopeptidase [Candidatus Rhodoluna planktonica]AOY55692.1 hypothetical protein A4Z71_01410 [Candidatus Rhodoluna planktonica]